MKKFLLGCVVAVAGLSMPAVAQDFCCPTQCNPCCYDDMDFDGFYVGGNVGVFTQVAHRNDLDGFLSDNSGWTTNDTDVTVGVQVGYDWQCYNTLLGIVADWNWVNTDHTLRNNPNGADNSFVRSEFDWFTTIRGRAGITVCDALIYLTAGAAVARFDTDWTDAPNKFHDHHTRWGWTGGVGLEYLVWCNWSLGAEFLFLHFDERTKSFNDNAGTTFEFGHSDSAWIGRIVLNYRFGDLCCWW